MTLEEYDAKVGEMGEKLRANWDEDLYDKLNDFQWEHMQEFLDEYQKSREYSPARQVCYELLYYAVYKSESGNSIQNVNSKEFADEVKETILDEMGHFLLDPPEIYKDGDQWSIDCMFGGSYIPNWDGWRD